jgi:pSer/pThr/pTyr-binding forkhead associated (FHA) protein
MYFELVDPPYTKFPFPGPGGLGIIGRAVDCDVVLPRPDVAKQHAYFVRRERHWLLCYAINRQHRTLLNGQPVRPPFQVLDGYVLTVGDVELKFVSEA